jgi:cytoskeleton protein RodZ
MSDQGVNEYDAADGERQDFSHATQAPGAQLAAFREARGWSIEQVASQLNLAPRQILAIERDDYPALPGMPIVRGFIRAYAKVLKVDPMPLLATISGAPLIANESISPRRALSTPFSETRLPSMMDRPGLPVKKIAVAAVIVALLAGVWVAQQSGELSALSGALSSKVEQGLANIPSAAPDAAKPEPAKPEAASPGVAAAGDAPSSAAATESSAPAAPVMPARATEPPASAPSGASPVATARAEQPAVADKDALVLKLREDSWVEVKRSDGSVLIARIAKAGTTETFEITGPVSVVIGNVAGVDASLRGNPLELKGNTGSNIARLSLK